MTLLWLTLLFLHQGYTLVPLVTVELGQHVTLKCDFPEEFGTIAAFHWYRQSAGDALKLIWMPQKTSQYEPELPTSQFSVTYTENSSNLTIFTTVKEDEGMYHCAHMDWQKITWGGTYLSIKGKSERESSYTVVQRPTLPDPSHKADSDTLQCSLLSDSEIPTCSGEPSVFWFRASSVKSFPDIIYTDGKGFENCEKTSDSQKRCVYNFSKNINSSDAGTYYCAVATCGQILFGNGADLKMDEAFEIKTLVVTVICLIISVIINIIFICCQTQRCACQQYKERSSQRGHNFGQRRDDIAEDGPDLNYAALHFSEGRASRGKKRAELMTESVYSQVKG